ncbi:hypothetical protein [Brucella pseudogrignonensis]|uniref:hypothetical protein n=1 Tax=Brucella pseudogrignonensis TaxID=419475 RepID=UPI000CFB70E5|nr:hypothetical protein [Brucella pseudogrignonensis]MQP38765.1 hypothetical protein [Ochrobactrum sp. MYb237]PQZ43384.1 hypothetical protein CQ059_05490 [Brucella pseudogrignonensis]PRA43131.1 hypothetical protein CQ063_01975 [Brucella pseudogrignonensis]PRA72399.1 hypothetical protein CQ055_03605 [Brucella pseudogrignonensis]
MATTDELCFHVEQWTDDGNRLETLLSASCNALMGVGAFEKAVELRGHKRLTLRHGARVIRSHTPEPFRLLDEKNRAELERQIEAAQAAYKARSVGKS